MTPKDKLVIPYRVYAESWIVTFAKILDQSINPPFKFPHLVLFNPFKTFEEA